MRRQAPITTLFAALAALFLAAPAAMAQATAEANYHGRVSFADNDGLVKGASDDDWSYATINSLVLPGDTVWADNEGVLELEFSGGTFVRLADGSKLEIAQVPPNATFRAWNGSFYVQRIRRSSGDVIFETPVGQIAVDENTQMRVDILSEGQTTVTVRWGRAIVGTQTGQPVEVTQGMRTYIDPGYLPSTPVAYDRSYEDDFDAWNRERARLLAVGTENVPILTGDSYDSAPVGVSDLNSYGEWIYTDDDYYWRPTVIREYVPYREGYWSYAPSYGYSWVGHYPFSYVTSHYGYWDYHHHYGWLWKYNRHYRPAYCATLYYGNHFIWTPLGFNGHPVHYGHDYFTAGGIRFSIYGSSYSLAVDLLGGYGHHRRYVHGLTPHYYNGIHAGGDVNIWNININTTGRYSDTTYRGTTLPVRDYTPQRVMRGPATLEGGSSARLASARVASLESSARSQFRATGASSARAQSGRDATTRAIARTEVPRADSARSARVRSASLRSTAAVETTRAIRHAERTNHSTRELMSRRSGRIETLTNSDARSGDTLRNIAERAPRTTSPADVVRSTRGASSTRSESNVRSITEAPTRDATRGVTTVPGRGADIEVGEPRSTRTTRETVIPGRTGDADARSTRESAAPAERGTPRAVSPRTDTRSLQQPTPRATRSSVPEGSFESALPRSVPGARSDSRVVTPSERTYNRSMAPSTRSTVRSTTPSRSFETSPRTAPVDRKPDLNRQPSPEPKPSVTRVAPRELYTRPSTPSQRVEAPTTRTTPRYQAPSRPSSPRVETPSRTYSAPRQTAPSRTYSAPRQTAPSRTYSAPRQSAPSRSYSAPRSSAPSRSYTAPRSSSSSRSFTSPRSSSRSSSISSGRTSGVSRGAISRGSRTSGVSRGAISRNR